MNKVQWYLNETMKQLLKDKDPKPKVAAVPPPGQRVLGPGYVRFEKYFLTISRYLERYGLVEKKPEEQVAKEQRKEEKQFLRKPGSKFNKTKGYQKKAEKQKKRSEKRGY